MVSLSTRGFVSELCLAGGIPPWVIVTLFHRRDSFEGEASHFEAALNLSCKRKALWSPKE